MLTRYLKFLCLIFLCAFGCTPQPKDKLATLSTSSECNSVVQDALKTDLFSLGDWPSKEWWRDFEDPVLNWLIEAGLHTSPTLKRAESRFKAAAQVALQKKALLFPEVAFDADTDWEHLSKDGFFRAFAPTIPPVVNDINLGFSLRYEFDFWGKNRSIFKAALGEAVAYAAETASAELMLTTSIAYTYAQLQFLLYKERLLEKLLFNQELITGIRIKRKENALDTKLLPLGTEANTLQTLARLVEVRKQSLLELHRLKALTALGQDNALKIEYFPLNPLTLTVPSNLSIDLISRRPDLTAQRARVEAAAKLIHVAQTAFYPNVNLMAFVGLESVHWSTLLRGKNYSGSLEPAIHLPIFTAGRLRAGLEEKASLFNEAVFAYNELILQVAEEVADRLTDLMLLQEQIEIRKSYLRTGQDEAALTQRRFAHAIDDQLALLDAKNVVLERELLLAELEYGKQLAGILLIRALGGGYHE
jgi:NodT family efflux transporter outer membrane factor (OMF) lipoprotein